jgi:RNA polymerase sigma-70 factor (ECF subfamily)
MPSQIVENSARRPVHRSPDDVSKAIGVGSPGICPLEAYRGYVSYLVRKDCPAHLARQVEHEDLVQDVLLKVWTSDADFSGRSEAERLSFLRKTCACVMSDSVRYYDRGKRKVALEQRLDDSSARLEEWLAAIQSSPSQWASKHEQLLRLTRALAELPDNQRRAVDLHHLQRHSLAETAAMMGVSAAAAAGLLRRGLASLRDRLDERKDCQR